MHGDASRSFALGFGNSDREDAIREVGEDAVPVDVAVPSRMILDNS